MQKNNLFKQGNQIIRVLEVQEEQAFVIDCTKRTMPKWIDAVSISQYTEETEQEMQMYTSNTFVLSVITQSILFITITIYLISVRAISSILLVIQSVQKNNSHNEHITVD